MGCVECKLCKQEDEKNQFEYPTEDKKKIENTLEKSLSNNKNNIDNKNLFYKEFDEKIKLIGNYLSEKEFEMMIPEEAKKFINNESSLSNLQKRTSYQVKPVEFENGNIYHGQWNDNFEMEGYGKYFLKNEKVLAEGVWEKGELKKARIFYPNGELYEGEMTNSNYNGKGKLISQNYEYDGEFVDGEKTGEGTIKYKDGTEYTWRFSQNNFNGYGNMKWNNDLEYKGYFKDNCLEGNGTLFNKRGEKYEGNFEKNAFHGKGKYIYSNGDEYEGDFEYGIRKGRGIYKKNNGFIYEGLWDNNVPNGYGKITINDKKIKCNFHNGKIIDENMYEEQNDINYNFYNEPMNLLTQKLAHLENIDVLSSQFGAGTMLSFLDE
jgi:hypothetical protein